MVYGRRATSVVRLPFFRSIRESGKRDHMNRSVSLLFAVVVAFTISIGGCSDSGPKSVTEGVEQSAIDAYKANEAKIEAEAAADMELED